MKDEKIQAIITTTLVIGIMILIFYMLAVAGRIDWLIMENNCLLKEGNIKWTVKKSVLNFKRNSSSE